MALEESKYKEELDTCLKAARKAGKVIDKYAREGFKNWKKEDDSFVTEADIKSQKTVVSEIREKFPDDGFLGEEENLTPGDEKRIWVIDPIDGTFNFKRSFGNYCVSIALKINGKAVLGVVHAPESSVGETFFSVRGQGSYLLNSGENINEASKIEVSGQDSIENAVFFAGMNFVYKYDLEPEKEAIRKLASKGGVDRQLGACALNLCYLAAGRADLMIDSVIWEWDFAAGKLILEEAGGKIKLKESVRPDSYGIIASNGKLQSELEELTGESE